MSTRRRLIRIKTDIVGRSMVEMVGVLSIVGFLTFGGIYGYVRASKVLRINDLKDEISTLVANIRAMHIARNDYGALDNTTLIGSGFVPEKYISEDRTEIIHPQKGKVLVGTGQTKLSSVGAFILIFNGLDAETCRELGVVSWGSDMASGFLGMTIKKDGDLTVATSNLVPAEFETQSPTFKAIDLPQELISDTYDTCDCGNLNNCSIAWKFL